VRRRQNDRSGCRTADARILKKWINPKSRQCAATQFAKTALHAPLDAGIGTVFHYRNLDVSSVKELAKRWRPEIMSGLKEKCVAFGDG
jgi:oligoribonuclease